MKYHKGNVWSVDIKLVTTMDKAEYWGHFHTQIV